jgi:hypothetical protein
MPDRSSVGLSAGARRAAFAAVLLASGCNHTEPFDLPPYGSESPFDPSPPQRLTYNTLADRAPSWLNGDAGLLYSAQQTDRADADVCAAILPPTGGTQRQLWCDVPGTETTRDAIEAAAEGPDGRLAFVNATGATNTTDPFREVIAVAATLDPRTARMVRSFPYTPAGSTAQHTAQQVRWLDATRLIYVGQNYRVHPPCFLCVPDTLRAGKAVTILEVDTPGAPPIAVPGTENATGVAPEPGGGSFLYTVGGDSRVYRHTLSSGSVQVVHDFAGAGIARDIHLAGNQLAAVVGGRVTFSSEAVLGPFQWDSGGVLHVVNLGSGAEAVLDTPGWLYRRPALSSDGARLAAEGYPLIISQSEPNGPADTLVDKSPDLYLFGAQ